MTYVKKIHKKDALLDAHECFERDGIVFFDRLLADSEFDEAEKHIVPMIHEEVDTESLVNLHLKIDWFANFVSRQEFLNTASSLLGVKEVRVFSSMILNKPANGLMTVPWHQDAAYDWPLDPVDCASLWLAFDDITTQNGAMKVAVGAHKAGKISMESVEVLKKGNDRFFSTQLARSIPESKLSSFDIIDVTMNKGQSSFHHSMLPHCSTPNHSPSKRCAFIVRYCRDDAVLNKYPGMSREEYFKDFVLFNPYN